MSDTGETGDRRYLEAQWESPGIVRPLTGLATVAVIAQCVEVFEQLRGDACNQIDRARIPMAHNIGDPTAVSAVTMLEGPEASGE